MKKLLIGLLTFVSLSTFANDDCQGLVGKYKCLAPNKHKISKFEITKVKDIMTFNIVGSDGFKDQIYFSTSGLPSTMVYDGEEFIIVAECSENILDISYSQDHYSLFSETYSKHSDGSIEIETNVDGYVYSTVCNLDEV